MTSLWWSVTGPAKRLVQRLTLLLMHEWREVNDTEHAWLLRADVLNTHYKLIYVDIWTMSQCHLIFLLPPHDAVQPQPFSLLQNENNTTFHQQPAIQLIFFQWHLFNKAHSNCLLLLGMQAHPLMSTIHRNGNLGQWLLYQELIYQELWTIYTINWFSIILYFSEHCEVALVSSHRLRGLYASSEL